MNASKIRVDRTGNRLNQHSNRKDNGAERRRAHLSRPVAAVLESLESRMLLNGDMISPYILSERFLFEPGMTLSAPASGKPLDIALNYLSMHAADLGLTPDDLAEPIVTDEYTDADTGLTHLYLRQQVGGVPVDNTSINVNLTRDGQILSIGGAFAPGIRDAAAIASKPTIAARQSFAALGSLGIAVPPEIAAPASMLNGQTSYALPTVSLDPIVPRLHYVATSAGLTPAWEITVRTPDQEHWYDAYVDAASGEMLYASDWVGHPRPAGFGGRGVAPGAFTSPSWIDELVILGPFRSSVKPMVRKRAWYGRDSFVRCVRGHQRHRRVQARIAGHLHLLLKLPRDQHDGDDPDGLADRPGG